MVERRLWFVRRNGLVKGPFLPAQISRNILLGRLRPDDEISPDESNWQIVAMHRELFPDVMQDMPVASENMKIAKMQMDERVMDQRRQKQKMAQERRQTRERRVKESDAILIHRQHREESNNAIKNSFRRPKMPFFSILLMAFMLTTFGYVFKPENRNLHSDCSSPPSRGVNWSNCSFINLNAENQNMESSLLTDAKLNKSKLLGANLTGSDMAYAEITESDLSYANLENVRLLGANLKHSDLRYANLKDADLSYADLSGVLLAGASMINTRFDNAIWIDGRLCKKGSIGLCRSASINQ